MILNKNQRDFPPVLRKPTRCFGFEGVFAARRNGGNSRGSTIIAFLASRWFQKDSSPGSLVRGDRKGSVEKSTMFLRVKKFFFFFFSRFLATGLVFVFYFVLDYCDDCLKFQSILPNEFCTLVCLHILRFEVFTSTLRVSSETIWLWDVVGP